jgi:hypothetical protein
MDGQTFVPINAHVTHSGHNYEFIGSFGVHKHHSSDAQSDHILRELRKEFYSTDDAPAQSKPPSDFRNLLQRLLQAIPAQIHRVLP